MDKAADIRVVLKNPAGVFKVDRSTHIIFHCSDGKFMEVPKSGHSKCSFLKAPANDEDIPDFEFPATVLENLFRWTMKYGTNGVAASKLTRPCTYRLVSYVFTDAWDLEFFNVRLCGVLNQKHFLETMSAADKLNLPGLLDFMAVGLGCRLRGEEDPTIIHEIMGLPKEVEISEDDLKQVSQEYSWFDDMIKPVDVQ